METGEPLPEQVTEDVDRPVFWISLHEFRNQDDADMRKLNQLHLRIYSESKDVDFDGRDDIDLTLGQSEVAHQDLSEANDLTVDVTIEDEVHNQQQTMHH